MFFCPAESTSLFCNPLFYWILGIGIVAFVIYQLFFKKSNVDIETEKASRRTYKDALKHLDGLKIDAEIKVNNAGSGKYGNRKFTVSFELPGSNMTYTSEENIDGTVINHDELLPDETVQICVSFREYLLEDEVPEDGIDWDSVYSACLIEFFANKKTAKKLFQ